MFETYIVNGDTYQISQAQRQQFLIDFPEAVLAPNQNQQPPEELNMFDEMFGETFLGKNFNIGFDRATTTGEAGKLFMEGTEVNNKTVREFMEAKKDAIAAYVPSVKMQKFQKKYKEAGGGWANWWKFTKEDPVLLAELLIQSVGTQVGTAWDSPEARQIALGGFVPGAVAGYKMSPGDARVKAISAFTTGTSTALGSLTAVMETTLTFGELIEKELKESNQEWTEENILKLLQGSKGQEIRNKAAGRGIAIGFVETATMQLAGKTASSILKAGPGITTKIAAAAGGVGVEAVGGGLGEIAGMTAAGQEYDAAEIGFEAVTGTITAPISVGGALLKYKTPKYTLNNEVISYEKMKSFVNTATDMQIATANIKMENDQTGLNKTAYDKQSNAIIDNSIDKKITNLQDRKDLISLEKQRQQLNRDIEKKGAAGNVGATQRLEAVDAEIKSIIDSYAGAVGIYETKQGKQILQTRQEINLQDTIDFLEKNKEFVGKEVVVGSDINKTQEAYAKAAREYNKKNPKAKQYNVNMDITKSDGFVVGDVVVINKVVAAQKGQINVGAHELLHGILKKHFKSLSTTEATALISEFRKTISKESNTYITNEFNRRRDTGENLDITEWLTIYSDGITKKEISFNESVSVKLKNFLQNIFRKFTYNKEFGSGLDTYNFMRDYQKSVAKGGEISSRAKSIADGGTAATDLTASMSETPLESINKLVPSDVKSKKDYDAFIADPRKNKALFESISTPGGVINNYIRSRQLTQEEGDIMIEKVQDRVLGFDPDAKRKDGTRVGMKAFGERIFADTRYAKLDAKKDIAIDKKKESKTTRIDAAKRTKEGETTFDIEDTNVTPTDIDTQDMSPAARAKRKADKAAGKAKKTSKFRKELGIEENTKTYDAVLDAARQALLKAYEGGTTARNIQRKLRDQAVSYLFKSFKNFISYGVATQVAPRGSKDIYFSQLKKFREAIVDVVFTADLVQLEKKVPDSEKIFTKFEKKLTRKAEVEAAVEENKLPKEALNAYDKDKSVNLYKKITPSEDKFIAFFNQPAISPKTGLRSGLKGTRKDAVARLIAGALSYDATMQVASEPAVVKKRKQLADIRNESDAINSLETLAAQIHRDQDVMFSNSVINKSRKAGAALFLQQIENKTKGVGRIFVRTIKELVEGGVGIVESYETARAETGIDSDVLDLIFKQGKFDNKHIDSIIYGINKFGVGKIRKLGFDSAKKHLLNKIKNSKDKVKVINEFLINVGRSTRSAGVDGITTNEQLLNFIDELGIVNIKNYKLEPAKFGGKKIQYLDSKTNTYKDVALYENIENIKNNIYNNKKLQKIVADQAAQAQAYILEIVNTDSSILSNAEKKAMMKLLVYDQLGAIRKVSNIGMSVDASVDKQSSKFTVLEHEITANDMLGYINQRIDNDISETRLLEIFDMSKVHVLPKTLDTVLNGQKLKYKGGLTRYENQAFLDAIKKLIDKGVILNAPAKIRFNESLQAQDLYETVAASRSKTTEPKGITVLDFDDTLATSKSMIRFTRPDGTKGKLNAEQYASTYEGLSKLGYKWDFSEFTKVVDGKTAPLFNKAMKLQGKFGPENMFILTARPAESAAAIHAFIKANGLNIPLKNITGLANSTAESKANWIAGKVKEGYNDFYFADDAIQNVKAVKNMLDQFDVKSKVQQARVEFSNSMDTKFNKILENVSGIDSKAKISAVNARKRGESKGKFRYFIPPSHEDFIGLLYNFMGKGRIGDGHRNFFENALIRPLNRAYRELDTARQSIANDYRALNKEFESVKDLLNKKVLGDFTYQDAIRVYLWNKNKHKVPGLEKTEIKNLVEVIKSDPELKAYADNVNVISKRKKYVDPSENWETGDIRTDLDDATGRVGRGEFFAEFQNNADIIFSEKNLNKIEAGFGASVRSAIEDVLYRTKTGRNRPTGQNALVNKFMNYLNGSVASTMFVNVRSAILQQMSIVNFVNYSDNNIFAVAKAFSNQKQYYADWAYIFNSDFMKQRRGGIKTDVNGAELAASLKGKKNSPKALLGKLLQLGFLPTQIGDNIAIATGGASFYRNRVNKYVKSGLSLKEAEKMAWTDFQAIAEETQQSARPDMVSQQQASPLGKVILAFQNVTSQFNRIGKKAFLDLKNRRMSRGSDTQFQSDVSNVSRIGYYFAMQNLIFYTLQSALFTMMFDDNADDEKMLKKKERVIQGSIDSVLRGTGVMGSVVATLKNMAIKWHEQREKKYNPDESAVLMEMLNVSPPLGIKARKLVNAEKTLNYNKNIIKEMETFDIDNPVWSAVTNVIESTTNAPANRIYNKTINVRNGLDNQYTAFQRALFFSGFTTWSLGLGDTEKMTNIKETVKDKKKLKNKKNKKSKKKKKYNFDDVIRGF